jgi:hypothetical protein
MFLFIFVYIISLSLFSSTTVIIRKMDDNKSCFCLFSFTLSPSPFSPLPLSSSAKWMTINMLLYVFVYIISLSLFSSTTVIIRKMDDNKSCFCLFSYTLSPSLFSPLPLSSSAKWMTINMLLYVFVYIIPLSLFSSTTVIIRKMDDNKVCFCIFSYTLTSLFFLLYHYHNITIIHFPRDLRFSRRYQITVF